MKLLMSSLRQANPSNVAINHIKRFLSSFSKNHTKSTTKIYHWTWKHSCSLKKGSRKGKQTRTTWQCNFDMFYMDVCSWFMLHEAFFSHAFGCELSALFRKKFWTRKVLAWTGKWFFIKFKYFEHKTTFCHDF